MQRPQMTKEEILQRRKDMALLTQQGYSIPKIAVKYGISRQAVSQCLQKAAKDGHKVVLRKCGSHINKDYEYRPSVKEILHKNSCVICGKAFETRFKTTRTCGGECRKKLLHKSIIEAKGSLGKWSRYESVTLTCHNCGKSFERSNYRDSISKLGCGTKNSYCSRDCYYEKARKDTEIVLSYTSNHWPSLDQYNKNLEEQKIEQQ